MTGEPDPRDATAQPEVDAPEGPASEADAPEGDVSDRDAFQLALPAFHGPLDLLLQLIERSELDITEVSLLEVTEQYLQHMRASEQVDVGQLADFIAIGARLLLLKSRALLPREESAVEEDEADPAGDVRGLIEALKEYRRFKQAAEFLRERDGGHSTYRREVPPPEVP
ncbi:MAG: segregation/condensation protein A, partial [Dehalococcoidia bacterium]